MHAPTGAALLLTGLLLVSCSTRPEAPARLLGAGEQAAAERRLELRRCTSCHAADGDVLMRVERVPAPSLAAVGARATPAWLRRFLTAPQQVDPGTPMPDMLATLGAEERAQAVEALVHFLVRQGGPLQPEDARVGAGAIERGRQGYHELGCVACHAPLEDADELEYWHWSLEAPPARVAAAPPGDQDAPDAPLGEPARKWTRDSLARFLADPLAARPSGRMPSLRLSAGEARDVASYLLAGPARAGDYAFAPGLRWDYFERAFDDPAPELDGLAPTASGLIADLTALPPHRADEFAFRFEGVLAVERAGEHAFHLSSDDGARLWVDGRLVVANDGVHPLQEASGRVHLAAGRHALVVSFFEAAGEEQLIVEWTPPGAARAPLPAAALSHAELELRPQAAAPFRVDEDLAHEGGVLYTQLGCWGCHQEVGRPPEPAPALAELRVDAPRGCLAGEERAGVPRFAFEPGEAELLHGLLATWRADAARLRPLAADEEIERAFARLGCRACHARGGRGGPDAERRPYFRVRDHADLGDQGRFPPHLEDVGSKLLPQWTRAVLLEGGASRPYMATRMPDFGAGSVQALPALFELADAEPLDMLAPPQEPGAVEHGRELVGTGGLGCIQCHRFSGYESLGVPAVDLAEVTARIKPAWFRQLLLDPKSLDMNTRMPEFWTEGRSPVDLLGRDPARQVDAIWSYLRLGHAMPLPDGLVVDDAEYELVPRDAPILCGLFMAGASPRTLFVGTPELVHYAFDVQNSRLVALWRGRFFNARGTWHARAGALESPPEGALWLPEGPALAELSAADQPWPRVPGAEAGMRPLGRRYDAARRPAFRWAWEDVEVEERLEPVVDAEGARLRRRLELRAPRRHDRLHLRAAVSSAVRSEDGAWVTAEGLRIAFAGEDGVAVYTRATDDGRREVLMIVLWRPAADGAGFVADLEMELGW